MKPLLISQVLGRPSTTAKCFDALLRNTDRNEFEWVIVDQNSSQKVKDVIKHYEPNYLLKRDFNSGIVFGMNEAIAKYRQLGQSVIKLDDDVLILNPNWLSLFNEILSYSDMGTCLGRRPTFFIDEPSRFEVYKTMPREERNGIWLEFATIGVVGCWWMIKGEVLDKIGYLNSASQNDDYDFWYRTKRAGWDSVYIPDATCIQLSDEPVDHPTYGIMKKIVEKNRSLQLAYNALYDLNHLYLGTRFAPREDDMVSYINKSQANWEEFKNE